MGFAEEIGRLLPQQDRFGDRIEIVRTWNEFLLLASPLLRAAGRRLYSDAEHPNDTMADHPEKMHEYVWPRSGDVVAIALRNPADRTVRTILVWLLTAPDTAVNTLRLGEMVRDNTVKRTLWAMGIRKMMFKVMGQQHLAAVRSRHEHGKARMTATIDPTAPSRFDVTIEMSEDEDEREYRR